MAGKEDLQALSSYIAALIPDKSFGEDDIEGVGAVAMNRATQFGSLGEAIESLDPPVDFVKFMQGQIEDSKSYKKSIQIASRFLNGNEDKTKGAFFFFPKGTNPSKELGLVKTHGSKNYNFYKQGVAPEPKSKPRGRKVSKVQQAPVQEVSASQGVGSNQMPPMQGNY